MFREGVGHAKRAEEALGAAAKDDTSNNAYRGAISVSQRAAAFLMYALLRQGRTAEAEVIAQEWVARANQDNLGANIVALWQRRLARVLTFQRRYEQALAAAGAANTIQQKRGAEGSSAQTFWGSTEEIRALMGLQQWTEAYRAYSLLLEGAKGDNVAYQRAFNPLLNAILVAKSGQGDAALKRLEGVLRFRSRTYGENHPFTLEARGIRGAVHLINGSTATALSDYESLFKAILDTPSGWVDLNPTGVRGYYLEVAFDEFLRHIADSYRAGGASKIDIRVFGRIMQVGERVGSTTTQQAVVDAAARLRAETPELRDMLAKEQESRLAVLGIYREIGNLQRQLNPETPIEERKVINAKIKEIRASAESSGQRLEATRREIAQRFPAYVDLVTPAYPGLTEQQRALTDGETFVGILPTRFGTFTWAVNKNGQHALHVSNWTEQETEKRVATLRKNLDIGMMLPNALARFEFEQFHAVYRELLEPLAPALKGE